MRCSGDSDFTHQSNGNTLSRTGHWALTILHTLAFPKQFSSPPTRKRSQTHHYPYANISDSTRLDRTQNSHFRRGPLPRSLFCARLISLSLSRLSPLSLSPLPSRSCRFSPSSHSSHVPMVTLSCLGGTYFLSLSFFSLFLFSRHYEYDPERIQLGLSWACSLVTCLGTLSLSQTPDLVAVPPSFHLKVVIMTQTNVCVCNAGRQFHT